jgi:predicted short-subunit dehydrogenase-like oxidoreductase (DUF2520 family)
VKAKNDKRGRVSPLRRQTKKLSIAVIGAGRLGLALGSALQASGHAITIAITRTRGSARRASRVLRTTSVALGTRSINQLTGPQRARLRQSDLLIIATADDSIPQVAEQLAKMFELPPNESRPGSQRRSVVLHTSGALASDVLKPIREQAFAAGSLHPLISISGPVDSARAFSGVYFTLEGEPAAVRIAKQLVRELGGNSFVIDARRKPLYHAAALMASPNLTALIDIAVEMMSHCGFSSSEARKMLLPLIVSTIDNLGPQDARAALTGTFKRGDIATARMHLNAIASERLTDAMKAYVILGERSLGLSDISPTKKQAIESLLKDAMTRSQRH